MHRIKNIGSASATFSGEKTILNAYRAYPFGGAFPNRNFSSSEYRFGFNGKEKNDEFYGEGNQLDFGDRGYDPRRGQWSSIDSRFRDYVPFTPYGFALNNPILFKDADGNVVVDANGNPVTVSITKAENGTATATYQFAEGTSEEVKNQFMTNGAAIINDMLITKVGQEQVQHLIDTKARVTIQVSEDIGIASYTNEKGEKIYGVIYGVCGPTPNQSKKLIKDYDGGRVYEETTITLFKGSLKYGNNDKSALEKGNITLLDLNTGEAIQPTEFKGTLQPSRYPDMLYKSEFQLYNLGGIHESEHTKSSNIKTARTGGDQEAMPLQKEILSRKDPNFK
jgi:RHS repeat-associated protein